MVAFLVKVICGQGAFGGLNTGVPAFLCNGFGGEMQRKKSEVLKKRRM